MKIINFAISAFNVIKNTQAIKYIQDFFTSERKSESELILKALMTSSDLISKKRNGELVSKDVVESTVNFVDATLTKQKIQYQVGEGIIEAKEAMEQMIDRKTAQIAKISESIIKEKTVKAAEWIGEKIGSLGNETTRIKGKELGTRIGEVAGVKITQVVNKGIKLVGNLAKKGIQLLAKEANVLFNKLFA